MSRHRILVADDSATIQKVIKIAFSRHGYDIVEAASFIEAITAQSRAAADIIIADASLPGAHGPNDFLKIAHDGSIPLLLLVGSYESVDEDSFRSLGFSHFLKKPFESSDIVTLVDQLIEEMGDASSKKVSDEMIGSTLGIGSDRSQHTTVIHEGGIGLSFTDEAYTGQAKTDPLGRPSMNPSLANDSGPGSEYSSPGFIPSGMSNANPPPPPPQQVTTIIDETKKGRKAFSPDTDETTIKPLPVGAGGVGGVIPPPPFQHDQDQQSPLPSIPSDLGLMSQSSDVDMRPSSASSKQGGGARAAERGHDVPLPWQPMREATPSSPVRAEDYLDKIEKMVEDSVDDRLPPLVLRAIEDYCERHFKTLAREVITNELRRLAEEKARHLVDN